MYIYRILVNTTSKGGIMKNIKHIIFLSLILFLIVGCGNMMNTPTKKVEEFLSKYQTQDKEVLSQLDTVVDDATTLTEDQKDDYYSLMKKQYKNLNYKIKDEEEDGNTATVVVEVEVIDYGRAISDAEIYLASHRDEFVTEDDIVDTEKFMTYKIGKMNDVKDKVTYTINFTLTKEDGTWKLDDLNDIDRLKLHGLYY